MRAGLLWGAVIYVAMGVSAQTALKPEKARLVPDPQALEAEVGSIDVSKLAAMEPSAISAQPSEDSKAPADPSRNALGMTNQQEGTGDSLQGTANSNADPISNAAWKQDAASQGGNFAPDYEALRSAEELDQKVGREQAEQAAKEQAERADKADKLKKIKKKYDVEHIGDRGVGGGMNFFSIDREERLGREMAEEIDTKVRFFGDPQVNEYVNRLAQNLMRNSDAKVPLKVKIIDSDELNAFTLPGGYFYINVGMLMATESEAELAGVMAHEIGHVAARHATKNATKQQIWNFASLPLMFVGGPAGMIVKNVAQIAMPMSFMKFSRNAEKEADLLGLEYEYAAGYDPAAMVNFFEKLQSADKKKPNFVVRAFQTHPMTQDRLKRAQQTISDMLPDKEQYLVTSSEYEEMKGRLASMITNRLNITPAEKQKPALKSGKFSF